jgi:hypothetical protein
MGVLGLAGALCLSSVALGKKSSAVEPHTGHVRLPAGIISPQMLHVGMPMTSFRPLAAWHSRSGVKRPAL